MITDILHQAIFEFVVQNQYVRVFSDEAIEAFTGKLENYGWYVGNSLMSWPRKTTRLALKNGQSVIQNLDHSKKIEKTAHGVSYYVINAKTRETNRKMADFMGSLHGDADFGKTVDFLPATAEIGFGDSDFFVRFSHEDELLELLANGKISNLDLSEDESFQDVWRVLCADRSCGNPGLFVFVRADGLFQSLYYQLADTSNSVRRMKEKLSTSEDFALNKEDEELVARISETIDRWSHDEYSRFFGDGGIGVYQTEKGFLVRAVQLQR